MAKKGKDYSWVHQHLGYTLQIRGKVLAHTWKAQGSHWWMIPDGSDMHGPLDSDYEARQQCEKHFARLDAAEAAAKEAAKAPLKVAAK